MGLLKRNQRYFRFYTWCWLVCSTAVSAYNPLNVKEGIIEEALIETIGCSGMTHSAAMAAEVLRGKQFLKL